MKYLLTSYQNANHTQILPENVIPTRTGQIQGYGTAVTFTSTTSAWQRTPTYPNVQALAYSKPTVVTQ